MEYLIAIDAGTTKFKGAVFDENGQMTATHTVSYELSTPGKGFVEFKPENYEKILAEVILHLFEKSGIKPAEVSGISIDSQGETMICVDMNGDALCDAIVWLDNRAVAEAEEIKQTFDTKKIYEITGQPEIAATWPACKILWIRKNRPEIFEKTNKFLLLEDYLLFKLTGQYVTERSLISSTIYYDIRKNDWWQDMMELLGINGQKLPRIFDPCQKIGYVSNKASGIFGLSITTAVVTGALDQLSGMIGAGITDDDMICETTGTCLAVCAPVKQIPEYASAVNVPCHAGLKANEYYLIYWSQTAGSVLEWFKDRFYGHIKDDEEAYRIINEEASKAPPGAEGLVMMPHLSGMAFPEFNPHVRGVFYGIGLEHERKHFSRAVMESVAYMLREHIGSAEEKGKKYNEIRSIGGGSRSDLWNQIKADVTGKRIITLQNPETACLGTAMMAGTGIGLFDSISQASKKLVAEKMVYEPDKCNSEIYGDSFRIYKQLYESLKGTFIIQEQR